MANPPQGSLRFRRRSQNGRYIPIDLTGMKPLGGGGAGTVYPDPHDRHSVIKIYNDASTALSHRDKVVAMVANPPDQQVSHYNGIDYVQIAWPKALVETTRGEFAGFSMPFIQMNDTCSGAKILNARARHSVNVPDQLPFRIGVARNLSSVAHELHKRRHFVVDLHPGNLRFYKDHGFICLIDTDGYSIDNGGNKRYPAGFVMDQVVCPEGQGRLYSDLGEDQDRFALALYIFQLLNEGINPFQGISRPGRSLPSEIPRLIAGWHYAYGQTPNPSLAPVAGSIHEWLDADTRDLFDRAFGRHQARPSAKEWRDHCHDLGQRVKQCSQDQQHYHFSRGCPWCARPKPITQPLQVPAQGIIFPRKSGTAQPSKKSGVGRLALSALGGALIFAVIRHLVLLTSTPPQPVPVPAQQPGAPQGRAFPVQAQQLSVPQEQAETDPRQTGLLGRWTIKGNLSECTASGDGTILKFESDGSRLRFNGGDWMATPPADADGWRKVDGSTMVRVRSGVLQARDASVSGNFAEFQQ